MKITKDDLKSLVEKFLKEDVMSEGLRYHSDNNLPLRDCIYRPGSKKFFSLVTEARDLYLEGVLLIDDDDADLLETDIGKFGVYEGREVALDYPIPKDIDELMEAEYKGRRVELNKPKRGGSKKFYVYVRDPKTKKIKRVEFGVKGGGQKLAVKLEDPKARKSFAARHRCKEKKDRTAPGYWACRIGRFPNLFSGKEKYTWW